MYSHAFRLGRQFLMVPLLVRMHSLDLAMASVSEISIMP